jgi:hypothetical protein
MGPGSSSDPRLAAVIFPNLLSTRLKLQQRAGRALVTLPFST